MLTLKYLTPLIAFIICTAWIKPWRKEISSNKLLTLLFIDSLSMSTVFNLNYYKIFSLYRWKHFLKAEKNHIKLLIFLSISTLISGLIFILIHPELKDPNSQAFIDLPIIRIFRHQFTLIGTFLFSYEIFKQLQKESYEKIFKFLEIIGIIISLGIFIEFFFRIDLYSLLSGGRALVYGQDYLRARGFSYEPRGAAQVLTVCLISTIFYSKFKQMIFFQVIFVIAMVLTKSISGIALLGITNSFVLLGSLLTLKRDYTYRSLTSLAIFLLIFSIFLKLGYMNDNLKERSYVYKDIAEKSLITKMINRLEVFDAAYLNFLTNEPKFLIIGTGSGMGGYASQNYILEKDKYIFPNGSSALPLMGIVYLVAQFGIVVSLALILTSFYKLRIKRNDNHFFMCTLLLLFFLQYYYFLPFFISNLFVKTASKN